MRTSSLCLGFIAIFLSIASQAKGIFVYGGNEQNRFVTANHSYETATINAGDTGGFNENISVSFVNTNLPQFYYWAHSGNKYWSEASQSSYFSDDIISFQGSGSISDPFYHGEFEPINNFCLSATSCLKTLFTVDSSCQVSLLGNIIADGDYGGTCGYAYFNTFIKLTEEDGAVIFSIAMPYDAYDFDTLTIGTIAPIVLDPSKSYVLESMVFISCSYEGESAEYDLAIGGGGYVSVDFTMEIIPEPATILLVGLGGLMLRKRYR